MRPFYSLPVSLRFSASNPEEHILKFQTIFVNFQANQNNILGPSCWFCFVFADFRHKKISAAMSSGTRGLSCRKSSFLLHISHPLTLTFTAAVVLGTRPA